MIDICNISKSFGDVKALDKLTVQIPTASVFGLVGSNGSGKSTLLRILSGVYIPDKGKIMIDDEDITDNPGVRGRCCFVSDFPYFSNHATVENTAILYREMYPNWSDKKFKELSKAFRLKMKTKIITMSKGMQRQVAITLALSACPKYLFLDEIFDGLDPVVRQLVKKLLIGEIAENSMTVVIASHNLRELEDMCDHMGFLHCGGLLLERELDSLKLELYRIQAAFSQPLSQELLKPLDIVDVKNTGNLYTLVVRGNINDINSYINSLNPVFVQALPLTLEEIFISEMEAAGYDIDHIIE